MNGRSAKNRYRVVGLLVLLSAITYLDRVCIFVAGPRMQEKLHINPIGWGWVTGVFTLSYCLFEIPTGALADRIGPRRVLTRIVLWWSAFTALTAKCIVVDGREVFISSTNFTEAAQYRNIEVGVILLSPTLARQAIEFFTAMTREGICIPAVF